METLREGHPYPKDINVVHFAEDSLPVTHFASKIKHYWAVNTGLVCSRLFPIALHVTDSRGMQDALTMLWLFLHKLSRDGEP
jgi:hypothetical protein